MKKDGAGCREPRGTKNDKMRTEFCFFFCVLFSSVG